MRTQRTRAAALCGLMLFLASAALADEFHYVNIFVGDRAAGMGGAYTAIADGPEGAYYNPAGLGFASSAYLSVSTNALQIKETNYRNVQPFVGLGTDPVDYQRRSFAFIPNFFGFVQRADEGAVFAFTLASTDNEGLDQRDKLSFQLTAPPSGSTIDSIVLNTNYTNARSVNEVGPSVAWLLGENFSIGASLFAVYEDNRVINQNVNQAFNADGTSSEFFTISSIYGRTQLLSAKPQIGIQFMPANILALGYSTAFVLPVYGIYSRQSTSFVYDNSTGSFNFDATPPTVLDNQVQELSLFSNGVFEPTYWKHSIGAAWFASRSLVVAGDLRVHIPIADAAGTTDRVLTWNAAVGAEWFLSPNFPLRFGLFTNHSNQPDPTPYDSLNPSTYAQNEHLDYYGASLSFGYTTADSGINVGLSGSYGFGRAQIVRAAPLQNVDAFSLSIFVSGGYQF